MNKELCFAINGIELYMEQILVEYDDVPIFYLCNGDNDLYLVLRQDVKKEEYIIVKSARNIILDMLHGNISMRCAILSSDRYWDVLAEDNVVDDVVEEHTIADIPLNVLPYEDACYEVVTEEVEEYLKYLETFEREKTAEDFICTTTVMDNDPYGMEYMIYSELWQMVIEPCTKHFQMSIKTYMEYQTLYTRYLNEKFDMMYTSGDWKISVSNRSEKINIVTSGVGEDFALIAA